MSNMFVFDLFSKEIGLAGGSFDGIITLELRQEH